MLNGYTSSKVDEELRVIREENRALIGESSESNKSLMSSEIETLSLSDISTEFRHLNYIKIINDDEVETHDVGEQERSHQEEEKLGDLPPEIQKLVDEAMKNDQ